jgi:PilZ domain
MERVKRERRAHPRYDLRLALHYRIAQRGEPAISGSGLTLDLSVDGISFRCRRPLPVGVHIEMSVDWPALHQGIYPIELQATGFVIRSDSSQTAIRMTSHKMRVAANSAEPVRVPA